MRRLLASAAIAGALLAADIVLLVLYLAPEARLRTEAPALLLTMWLPYAAAATLGFLALGLPLAWLGPSVARPPVPGMPFFTTFALAQATSAAALFWLNLLGYRHSIPVPFVHALTAAAVMASLAALVLLGAGIDALLFPDRGRSRAAPIVVLAAAASVIGPLALRPGPALPSRIVPVRVEPVTPLRRVVLLGVDGLSPAQVEAGIREGRFAALAGLARRGAHGPLATLRPTIGPPVWTSIFTGRLPRDHGVKSFASYRLRGSSTAYELLPQGIAVRALERASLVTTLPVTAASRRAPALWDALNAFGIRAGVVRFWGTHPPQHVPGFMVSNQFHRLSRGPRAAESLFPPDLLDQVRDRAVAPEDVDPALVSGFVDLSVPGQDGSWRRDLVGRAIAPDLTYQRAGAVLRAAYDPPFFANYFYGLDVVGHAFTRYAVPERFGDVRPEESRRFGHVVERYAAFLGQWIAEIERSLRKGEVLFVVSGYGMEPRSWWRRLFTTPWGGAEPSGVHDAAPDGVVLAVGDGIRRGALLERGSVLDLAPTLLYLMGLPVARDMEGRVWTEILDEEFLRQHPVSFIPSYAGVAPAPAPGPPELDLPPLPEETP
ncbi:MAG TPA: alkaline phosphatase family protein [Vicinamibacteria bacterium]|nr:alkaline phosphatase family protein [Vicinamibacteria bacterium]